MNPQKPLSDYLTLNGLPVTRGHLLGEFGVKAALTAPHWRAADVKALGVGAALSAVFARALDPESFNEVFASNLEANAFNLLMIRLYEKFVAYRGDFSRDQMRNLLIDTRPEPEVAANSMSKYGLTGYKHRFFWASCCAFFVPALAMHTFLYDFQDLPGYTTSTAKLFSAAARWHNIATGKWAIVDRPPAELYENEKREDMVSAPV